MTESVSAARARAILDEINASIDFADGENDHVLCAKLEDVKNHIINKYLIPRI